MNLIYGNYQHDVGDAEVSISRDGLVSELGRMYAVRERWTVNGRLHGTSVSDVNSKVAALLAAYSVNGLDLYLSGSSHILRSSETINGTRVVLPPHFPKGNGAENSTFRSYTLAVEGEYAYTDRSVLLSWSESLSFTGTGGPVWGFLEVLNGPPQQQMFMQQSVVRCSQRGSAVCVPDSAHRNEYLGHWPPSPPIWPQWEHGDRRNITYEKPSDLYGKRTTSWAYEFSANVPLGAYPNASAGVVFHLG
ncbi:MAG: hypothetical protein WC378_00330 [Opitutaceae bacterium]|jgi:hypothetical protein